MPPAALRDPESDVVEDPSNVLEDPETDDPRTDQPSADADDAADAHAGAANGAAGAGGRGAPLEEEEDGEDLMGDGMAADYRRMGALDEYEEDGIDRADYSDDVDARGAADRELAARDATDVYGRSRGPRAFQDSSGDEDDAFQRRNHRQAAETAEGDGLGMDALNAAEVVEPNLDAFDPVNTSLAEWIAQPNISASVRRLFHRFLQTFTVGGTTAGNYYVEAVRTMCSHNRESLEVSYRHLSAHAPILAIWLADCPSAMLPLFDEEAMRFVCHYFNEYRRIQPEVHVRISELPIHDSIRDLRQVHLGCLVKVSGVVTRRTAVFPMLKMVKFDCPKCGAELGPYAQQASNSEVRPTDCHDCHSKGPFVLNVEQTVYRNYQKVTVQESPGTVPAGRLPRHKEVVLLGDLIDVARPGEEVEVTGVYMNNFDSIQKAGFPVFSTVIEANHVHKRSEEFSLHSLTDEEAKEIRRLAADPHVTQHVFDSIAPSVFGHQEIKRAVALSLFGAQSKDVNNKHRIRGDINVLLLGDPGTAKSQFLKYIEKTAHRAVYATGQGASAVGLTASVHRDQVTREWTLEGGALVLADRGVCLIDEFDKMNDQDRTSIHEAMEQQSISISKAGIVTSLQARCAVIAAANPINGRYEPTLSFADNVELSEPILSRFDVTCILRDTANVVMDETLAGFVIDSHKRSHPDNVKAMQAGAPAADVATDARRTAALSASGRPVIEQALLRKFIVYARHHCKPVLQDVDTDKLVKFYTDLRRESAKSGGIVVAVRHLESLIRLAEATARTQLRSHVRDDDIDLAISVMLRSFINSQKHTIAQAMERKFARYLNLRRDVDELLVFILNRLFNEHLEGQRNTRLQQGIPEEDIESIDIEVPVTQFEDKAREHNCYELGDFYTSHAFAAHGYQRESDQIFRVKQ
ncbi:MCM-domain-containing protein [Pavlovales sp. CCMP2436]|nr:MCM-domain-containing protein [Pavlovales sp. CCMP2436]